jgi:hypothetical protein
MNLDQHYEKLWSTSLHKFKQNNLETVFLIDSNTALRKGITL